MDAIHVALVKELVKHLCVQLDLNYDDEQLARSNNDEIRTLREAMALLFVAGAEPPEVYAHLMQRVVKAEKALSGDDDAQDDGEGVQEPTQPKN